LPEVVRLTVRFVLASILLCALVVSYAGILVPEGSAQPVLMLSSGSAQVGLEISVSGTGFLPTDASCVFSSPSSGALVSSSACIAQGGHLSGSFIVGSVPIGAYVIQASGNMGDSAQTILEVSGGAELLLSPATGGPGVDVVVQGSGFLPTDTTCTIGSPSSPNPILPGSGACVIQSGRAIGSFLIGNVPPGEDVIRLTGNQGDSAQALVDVG